MEIVVNLKKSLVFLSFLLMTSMNPVFATGFTNISDYDLPERIVSEVFPITFCLLVGWTAVSGLSFASKKLFDHWSKKYPENKERYMRAALLSGRVSIVSSVPIASFAAAAFVALCEQQLFGKYTRVSGIVALPGLGMTMLPACLISHCLHKK